MRLPLTRDESWVMREKEVWQDLQEKGFSQILERG